MKTKFILIFCSLIPLLIFGQKTYKSFIHSGITKWLFYSPQDGCMMDEVDAYGDTIINQLKYKKLWDTHFSPQPPYVNVNQQWREYAQFSGLTNTFVRQSSDSSELYFLDGTNNAEYLIADMNLKVGDEFTLPKIGNGVVVDVFYNDGLKNIQIQPEGTYGLTIIEGVGLNRHFKSLITDIGAYPLDNYLVCYSNNSYFYNTINICGCVETKIEEVNKVKHKVKKLANQIVIGFNEMAHRTWEFSDVYGKSIQKSEIINIQSIEIPVSDSMVGVYLLRIYNHNNKKFDVMKILL